MSALTDLPDWVWQLVAGLSRYEAEHPILYRMTSSDVYERTSCPDALTGLIPRDIRDAAELLARHDAIEVKSLFATDLGG